MRSTLLHALSLALALAAAPALAQSTPDDPRLEALEERFIAPCCWTEPLSSHDSPLARELREELRVRLARGETPADLEASLVGRYGERILSTPPGIEPVALGVLAAIALAAVLLGAAVRRRARGSEAQRGPLAPARGADPRLDAELERELARLEP
jgi:cytochrome c-type biogenesis protein CcmH